MSSCRPFLKKFALPIDLPKGEALFVLLSCGSDASKYDLRARMLMMEEPIFIFRIATRRIAFALTFLVLGYRIVMMVVALGSGDPSRLLAFPFSAILPAVLLIILAVMPPTRTREGLLMRVGAMIQLWLIILLPGIALYLALGFPVVFLVVEIFETRIPARIRDPLVRLVIA